MHLKVRIMRLLVIAITISFTLLEISNCSKSYDDNSEIKKEVKDFEEFLRQKFQKEANSNEKTGMEWSEQTPKEYLDSDYSSVEQNEDLRDSDIFESLQEESSQKVPYSGEVHSPEEIPKETFDDSSNAEEKNPGMSPNEQHHPMEEILYIRRSDTESKDPIADVLDAIVHGHSSNEAVSPRGDLVAEAKSTEQDKNEPSANVTCQNNFSSLHYKTCPDGPEYEMQFPAAHSEILKQDMEKMLPEEGQDDNKCDYRKYLTLKSSVEDRALCPFKWSVSKRNPSRIPEYLFEAKCSCQLSRNGKKCVEMKKVIPVLWATDCGPGSTKRYKQVWQEIAVACVPLEERVGHVLRNKADNMR